MRFCVTIHAWDSEPDPSGRRIGPFSSSVESPRNSYCEPGAASVARLQRSDLRTNDGLAASPSSTRLFDSSILTHRFGKLAEGENDGK
jgi:hypothetical protein